MPVTRIKTWTKQEIILDAASRVFSDRAYHEVLTEEIAEEAGIGKGTIYRYFANKEDLYFATIVHGFEKLYEKLAACVSRESSAERRLESIARETMKFFWNRRDFYALMYHNEKRFLAQESKIRKTRERLVRLVQQTIVDGIERREFRGIDPKTATEVFLGMLRAMNIFRRESDSLENLVAETLEIFTVGIAKREILKEHYR
jgi:TetR/AcrR family fatty acid metabolism transcriptional regulator